MVWATDLIRAALPVHDRFLLFQLLNLFSNFSFTGWRSLHLLEVKKSGTPKYFVLGRSLLRPQHDFIWFKNCWLTPLEGKIPNFSTLTFCLYHEQYFSRQFLREKHLVNSKIRKEMKKERTEFEINSKVIKNLLTQLIFHGIFYKNIQVYY